jgi:hypothetical protein
MTLAETMEAIERDEFAAELSLAAGAKAFRRAVTEHDLFRQLLPLAKETPEELAARIETISRLDIDERYENPFDVALSAYILALSDVPEKRKLVYEAVQAVLRTRKLWWADAFARELLLQTVAAGDITVGVDWQDSFSVRVNAWMLHFHDSEISAARMRHLVEAIKFSQPTGRNVIEFPSQEKQTSHWYAIPKFLVKRKKGSSKAHNIAQRKRA